MNLVYLAALPYLYQYNTVGGMCDHQRVPHTRGDLREGCLRVGHTLAV